MMRRGDCIRLQYKLYMRQVGLPVSMEALCWGQNYANSHVIDPQEACENCTHYELGFSLSPRQVDADLVSGYQKRRRG